MEKKQGAFRTTIGGQALIEGILMRGPEKDAIVVRSPEGLVTKVTERKFIKDRYPILGIPILRGAVTFISSMITGVKALMFSADYFPDDEDAKSGKFDSGWKSTSRRRSCSRWWWHFPSSSVWG